MIKHVKLFEDFNDPEGFLKDFGIENILSIFNKTLEERSEEEGLNDLDFFGFDQIVIEDTLDSAKFKYIRPYDWKNKDIDIIIDFEEMKSEISSNIITEWIFTIQRNEDKSIGCMIEVEAKNKDIPSFSDYESYPFNRGNIYELIISLDEELFINSNLNYFTDMMEENYLANKLAEEWARSRTKKIKHIDPKKVSIKKLNKINAKINDYLKSSGSSSEQLPNIDE